MNLTDVYNLIEDNEWITIMQDGYISYDEPLNTIHTTFWSKLHEVLHGGFYKFNLGQKNGGDKFGVGNEIYKLVAVKYYAVFNRKTIKPQQWVSFLEEVLVFCATYEVKFDENLSEFHEQLTIIANKNLGLQS